MNRKILKSTAMLLAVLAITACSPILRTTSMLEGEWEIEQLKEQTHGRDGAASTNIGVITLNPDQTGSKVSSFRIMGFAASDTIRFNWTNTENSIIIQTEENNGSKLWIIKEQRRNSQTWITTDGEATMQTMSLKRVSK